jgi:pimeloyl-ACP methyl ester carboxylesterase
MPAFSLRILGVTLAILAITSASPARAEAANGQYADVNGLHMYYEVHGKGPPLLLIHGGLCTIEVCFGPLIEKLQASRQVFAVELQGHGHTADIDRPLRGPLLASDMAALLKQLKIEKADVLGYSIGADVAYELAKSEPEQVNKLITLSLMTTKAGGYPEMFQGTTGMKAEMFAGTPWLDAYNKTAPNPGDFQDEPIENIKALRMPVMLIVGDSDMVRPEHAAELFRAVGGGVFGDMTPMPAARLAVLPGTTHVGLISRAAWIAEMVNEFLDAPPPKK